MQSTFFRDAFRIRNSFLIVLFCGDSRFDAAIAAFADYHLTKDALPIPETACELSESFPNRRWYAPAPTSPKCQQSSSNTVFFWLSQSERARDVLFTKAEIEEGLLALVDESNL
jgi:hypothetical protein